MKRTSIIIAAVIAASVAAVWAADEIQLNAYLRVRNGLYDLTRSIQQLQIDQGGQFSSYNVQSIATGAVTQVTITGGVTTNGLSFFRNLTTNTTRYVQIGCLDTNSTFLPLIRLNAGEPSLGRIATGTNVWAQSYGDGACNLEAWINQD